jgi:hypothetical protein
VDEYRRLWRYIVWAHDAVNINLHLVRLGDATRYYDEGRPGTYANPVETLAKHPAVRDADLRCTE